MTETTESTDDAAIHILVLGGDDLQQIIESPDEGGRATPGLAALIAARTGRRAVIEHRRVDLLSELPAAIEDGGVPSRGVVITSVAPALAEAGGEPDLESRFLSTMADVVARARAGGAHVLIAGASTYDPAGPVSCYKDVPEPAALSLHRLNVAAIELSVLDGISIIDADRVVAELGGEHVVDKLLSYREPAASALCEEIVRILADYRFFEDGHLVPQSGRRKD